MPKLLTQWEHSLQTSMFLAGPGKRRDGMTLTGALYFNRNPLSYSCLIIDGNAYKLYNAFSSVGLGCFYRVVKQALKGDFGKKSGSVDLG